MGCFKKNSLKGFAFDFTQLGLGYNLTKVEWTVYRRFDKPYSTY